MHLAVGLQSSGEGCALVGFSKDTGEGLTDTRKVTAGEQQTLYRVEISGFLSWSGRGRIDLCPREPVTLQFATAHTVTGSVRGDSSKLTIGVRSEDGHMEGPLL